MVTEARDNWAPLTQEMREGAMVQNAELLKDGIQWNRE